MPQFKVKWDGMGFTRYASMANKEFTEKQAKRLTNKLVKAGELPPGVHSVVQASVSGEDGKLDGEWKVFVGIEIVVEAPSLDAIWRMDAPEELLLKVADKMTRGDADSQYGLRGSFEVLEAEEWEPEPPPARKYYSAGQLRASAVSMAVRGV